MGDGPLQVMEGSARESGRGSLGGGKVALELRVCKVSELFRSSLGAPMRNAEMDLLPRGSSGSRLAFRLSLCFSSHTPELHAQFSTARKMSSPPTPVTKEATEEQQAAPALTPSPPPVAASEDPQNLAEATPTQQLKALFPNIDDAVLDAVLSSNGGDVDGSILALLSINDPDYKPDEGEEDVTAFNDENYARALQMEEEDNARRQERAGRQARAAVGGGGAQQRDTAAPYQPSYQAYQPRRRVPGGAPAGNAALEHGGGAQQQQGGGRDELDELTEQL